MLHHKRQQLVAKTAQATAALTPTKVSLENIADNIVVDEKFAAVETPSDTDGSSSFDEPPLSLITTADVSTTEASSLEVSCDEEDQDSCDEKEFNEPVLKLEFNNRSKRKVCSQLDIKYRLFMNTYCNDCNILLM